MSLLVFPVSTMVPGGCPATFRLASLAWILALCGSTSGSGGPKAGIETEAFVVEQGSSVIVPGVESSMAFQFNDGTIVVGKGEESHWSSDLGQTWQPGPAGPSQKVAIDLGDGEIIAIGRNTKRREDGLFSGSLKRSLDNWVTIESETPVIDVPEATSTVLGGGGIIDGFLFHHGIRHLRDGRLIATMYGNYRGDTLLCDGYPPELGQLKYRTVVVFSSDRGRTWGEPVMVAYDRMLVRGVPSGHPLAELGYETEDSRPLRVGPAITQEGFREADLIEAPNGDLLCVMRSGGRNPGAGTLFPTPLYCSRSEDLGATWSPPAQIADRGVGPDLLLLDNGVIVCTYNRPGSWLIFSVDNGASWEGAFQYGPSDAYGYLARAGSGRFVVFNEVEEDGRKVVRGTFFTLRRT
jgi:hypothetical protein